VVVLDQEAVVQAETMVDAAAATHGVFLQRAQAGDGLARVEDFALRTGDGIDETARLRGHARQLLEEVQRAALRRENRPGRAADFEHGVAGLERRAVLLERGEYERRILFAKNQLRHGHAGQGAGFLGKDACAGLGIELHARKRGDVSGAAVLAQCAHGGFADDGWLGRFDNHGTRRS